MILSQEQWMNLRAFKALADAGATWAEIARETGYDWRTVKRYLSEDAPTAPPAPAKRGPGPRKTDPYAHLIDGWLRRQPRLKASVIWERLVAEHGFTGHYQRVKVYVRENRARLTDAEPEPAGFHRRFEVLAGAQAQVDWGDEGEILTATGPLRVSSFHMTLSYSRDPFCCFTASQDLGTFWDCHRRAFAHFGGAPARGPRPAGPAASRGGRVRRPLRLRDLAGGPVPSPDQGAGGAPGRDRPQPRAGRPQLRLAWRAGRRVRRLAAPPSRADPPHPRRGHRHPGRTRPGRPFTAARPALCGLRPAQPPGRQGRAELVRGQPLLGALAAGPPRQPGRAAGHPHRGGDLLARWPAAAAGHPPSRPPGRWLGGRPGPLGRPPRPRRPPAAAAVRWRLRARRTP